MQELNSITVIVICYNPELNQLLKTINSVLLQKGVVVNIIITDDGSQENHFEKLKFFFKKKGFSNYTLIENKKNQGTVQNIYKAILKTETEYVKDISPGDLLNGENTLKNWLSYVIKHNLSICFSDTINYCEENGKFEVLKKYARPQVISAFKIGGMKLKDDYLLRDDLCCGATILGKTSVFRKYLEFIIGKVKYAEDNIFRLMIYNNEIVSWFDNSSILYECSSGVSASRKSEWSKNLNNDLVEADKVIESWVIDNSGFDRKLIKNFKFHKSSQTNKGMLFIYRVRKALSIFLANKMRIRKSPIDCDYDFLNRIGKL